MRITITMPDLIFFIVLLAIAAIFLLVYILTPIVKRKQFAEARANLKKREETFRENLKRLQETSEEDVNLEKSEDEIDATIKEIVEEIKN